MGLAHGRGEPAAPIPVEIAEPAVAVTVAMYGAVFLPQERQGHAGPLQLAMQQRPVGKRPAIGRNRRRRRRTAAVPAPRPKAPRAAARPGLRGAPGGDNRRPPCGRCSNRRQSAASTIRRHAAVERRVFYAWAISPGASSLLSKRREGSPCQDHPTNAITAPTDWPFCDRGIGGRIKSESWPLCHPNA